MKDIYYLSSIGVKLDLLEPPYMLQTGELLDYKWEYSGSGSKVAAFSKELEERKLLLSIINFGCQNYYAAINHFFETTEKDTLDNLPGKLYFGESYLLCNVTSSEKKEWESDSGLIDNEITLKPLHPFWISEKQYAFKSSEITSSNNKRYLGRYAHRYANGLTNTAIVNEHFTDCGFRMIIYGPVVKPKVIIGGYPYYIDILLEDGEYLEIDSTRGTIVKVMNSGIHVNCFHNGDKRNSVFRKIPPGMLDVDWSGKFDFDLTLYEERSEPKW